MIPRLPFGRTGHASSRAVFGAAALSAMRQERADQLLETLLEFGVNHIDVAASYGDAELRLAPWLRRYRDSFFLATKTIERTAEGARDGLNRSLERLGVDQVDLIQLHNLTDEEGWRTATGAGGALEALQEARERGRVRFIGVTGHGTQVAAMHLRSLEAFAFDSVLLPLNFTMMQTPAYAADFQRLLARCERDGVAVQTIKAVARRRWRDDDPQKRFSWYEPLREPAALRRAVHFALETPGVFLNTSSDATILTDTLRAVQDFVPGDREQGEEALRDDLARLSMEPLFVAGALDSI